MSETGRFFQAEGGPRERVAAAMRPLITMLVSAEFDDRVLEDAAEVVDALTKTMAAHAGPKRPRRPPDLRGSVQEFFPTSPIMGPANPIAPPVLVEVVDGPEGGPREIRAEAWYDWPYEGPPACVHGGVIAETLDEILGAASIVAGQPGMTGTLTIRYRKPTPLRTPLRIESRVTGRDGRKVFAWGGIYRDHELTAEAEGVFIDVMPKQLLAIVESNTEGADDLVVAAIREEAARAGAASDVQGSILQARDDPTQTG